MSDYAWQNLKPGDSVRCIGHRVGTVFVINGNTLGERGRRVVTVADGRIPHWRCMQILNPAQWEKVAA